MKKVENKLDMDNVDGIQLNNVCEDFKEMI